MTKKPIPSFKLFIIVLIAFCIYDNALFAQTKYITYHSKAEEKQFEHLEGSAQNLKLILLTDLDEHVAEAEIAKLDRFIAGLGWSQTNNQKPNKKLKHLFKQVHNAYLRKYDGRSSTSKMFTDGSYQCVSASILYAYIFEKLGIPYEIKEQPTHVYVVAFPQLQNILIETTDPMVGVYIADTKAQAKYVQSLVKNKYLEQEYVNKVGVEKAFNEFMYGKTNISFKELVGLAFYNLGIFAAEDENPEMAYSNFYKTNKLYPAKKHEFLQYDILTTLANESKLEKLDDWDALIILANNTDREDNKMLLKHRFSVQVNNDLIISRKREQIQEIHKHIKSSLTDTALMKVLDNNYYFESARSYTLSAEYEKALPLLEEILATNTDSPFAQSMLLNSIHQTVLQSSPTAESIEKLNNWILKYPELRADPNIQHYIVFYYRSTTDNHLNNDRFPDALKSYRQFVNELQNDCKIKDRIKNEAMMTFKHMIGYHHAIRKDNKSAKATYDDVIAIYPDMANDKAFRRFASYHE
ncbi:hypothetical protein FAZ19_07365 [Sphingobacterium alkalisoli]|uniref:Transglutaminase-like domain-containing protein n=1 Tax=Sphingobacterium alkalisoli TaxID=1874115 RepID=A0A4U0H4W8_9SPHI|nr:hypothetical protein [Sphingobacterium alkalisoli]TJY66730.1 hypothetical protein FAZ19_07365 [Sphingobacterium alkalisoli]GGH14543.1 hypothetical protein GCM10011418_15570 [Sphingobacterium alkalisoli]